MVGDSYDIFTLIIIYHEINEIYVNNSFIHMKHKAVGK